jgi:two-component system NarL family response regulator
MTQSLRVLLVDDHALVRIGLASVIAAEAGLEVCGEASTGARAIELYRSLRPDVVLMDLRLPDISGVEATTAIRKEFPDSKLVVISSFAPDEEVYSAIAAGAQAYVLKTIEAEELVSVIRKVASGLRHIPAEIAARLAARIPRSELTDRERDVLRLLARGYAYKEIAGELYISVKTVETHVSSVLRKTQLSNRYELSRWASDRRLV